MNVKILQMHSNFFQIYYLESGVLIKKLLGIANVFKSSFPKEAYIQTNFETAYA